MKKNSKKKLVPEALVIGDPHFRKSAIPEGQKLISAAVQVAKDLEPTFIVVLGDILDTHEVSIIWAYKLACRFLEELSEVAPTYLLIGNHDMADQKKAPTDDHFFGPYRKNWKNIFIVDKPRTVMYGDKSFVMCPYTPPGKLIETLDAGSSSEEGGIADWMFADCIFCHQEFYASMWKGNMSENGDIWEDDYPAVVNGHLHEEQTIGTNIFCPGGPTQKDFDEKPEKYVWKIRFARNEEEDLPFTIEKIDLGLPKKIKIRLNIDEVDTFDTEITKTNIVLLELEGYSEQFKKFRKSKKYAVLSKKLKINFIPLTPEEQEGEDKKVFSTSFDQVLRELIDSKDDYVKKAYREIKGYEDDVIYELEFEEE